MSELWAAALQGNRHGFRSPNTGQLCEEASAHDRVDAATLARRNVERSLNTHAASDSPIGSAIRRREIDVRGALFDLAHDPIETIEPPLTVSR
jgi:hypothetical protein